MKLSKAEQIAAENIARWRNDAVLFVREVFGVEPDDWQREFLEFYCHGKNPRTYAKACKGPGKTCVIAWACWHFLTCYPHPKIPATSITGDNLRNNLWAEMSKWQQKSDMLKAMFRWTATRIYAVDHPETWFMVALAWSQDADAEKQADTLAGYHADYIMFVLDEMGAIPDAVAAAAEGAMANAGSEANPHAIAKIIGAGNPTHLSGPLYRACSTEASICNVVEITGDPDSPTRSKRISIQWAREQIQKYGRDNPWVLVNVFGKFPPSSINALLGPDMVEEAMRRVVRPESFAKDPRIIGVDVALGGDDRTVLAPRQGIVCFKPKVLRTNDPKHIASVVAMAAQKFQADMIFVDNTGGFGSGVISWLTDWRYPVTGVQFAGKAGEHIYKNKRTEILHSLADFIKNGGCLPSIPELKEELCAQTYTHFKDQLLMTEKDQIKSLLGRSPDLADAYALTFAYPVARVSDAERMGFGTQNQGASGDYDPIKAASAPRQQTVDDYNPMS